MRTLILLILVILSRDDAVSRQLEPAKNGVAPIRDAA
jgi:hypothetical protein